MSEADDVEEDDVEDEQPDIDEDEMVDFSAVADEVEAETTPNADDDTDDEEDDQSGNSQQSSDESAGAGDEQDRISAGDVYCNALGMGAAVARASYGSADPDDRSDLVEDYGDMARDLQIDEYVDDWLEEQGGIDELSPGQAILLSTVMFGGMVAMDDPEMVDGLAQEVGA